MEIHQLRYFALARERWRHRHRVTGPIDAISWSDDQMSRCPDHPIPMMQSADFAMPYFSGFLFGNPQILSAFPAQRDGLSRCMIRICCGSF